MCEETRQHGSGGGRRKRTRTTGTSPAAYLTDTTHRDAQIKDLIATRDWLTVFYLPAYAPTLNPAEGVWSALKRSLANLAPHRTDALATLVKTRLRRMQYRTDGLLDGFVAETGLTLEPP